MRSKRVGGRGLFWLDLSLVARGAGGPVSACRCCCCWHAMGAGPGCCWLTMARHPPAAGAQDPGPVRLVLRSRDLHLRWLEQPPLLLSLQRGMTGGAPSAATFCPYMLHLMCSLCTPPPFMNSMLPSNSFARFARIGALHPAPALAPIGPCHTMRHEPRGFHHVTRAAAASRRSCCCSRV